MAGALGIQLGGPVRRRNILDPLPYIGDAVNRIERSYILKANRLMFTATVTAVAAGLLITKGIKGWL
jgi:cobalamin biosynthesis protein CobD/CbiB